MANSRNNKWYAKKRNKKILIAPENHLILCEGEKTEPNYFREIKNRIDNKYKGEKIDIEIIEGTKRGRLNLLKLAEEEVRKSKKKYNHVWLVYDKDEFNKDEFDNTVYKIEALNKKGKVKYHALWSNQCIEVWFLLHFIDLKVDVSREEYIEKINENWKKHKIDEKYTKNDKEIYNKLEKYQDTAIKRTKKIIEENKGKAPSKIAPGSTIYEIIEELKIYI